MQKTLRPERSLGIVLNRDNVAGYVFILPFIIGLVVFTVIPFFTSLYLAFTEYNVLSPAKWVGLNNFKTMFFEDKLFWTAFKVTFKFAFIQVPIKLTVSLLVALVLSRATNLTGFYRSAFYIPSLMGGSVAIALLWKQLFAYNGAINQLFGLIGLPSNTRWLGDPKTALGTLIALGVWQFGNSMLIFLAAIKNIPVSYHEAAIVDGAGPVRRFFSITLPMLTPILFSTSSIRSSARFRRSTPATLSHRASRSTPRSITASTCITKRSIITKWVTAVLWHGSCCWSSHSSPR